MHARIDPLPFSCRKVGIFIYGITHGKQIDIEPKGGFFMAKISINTRIKRENARLRERYKNLPEDSLEILDGLIDRAAFLRPTLEDMEKDIMTNGLTEDFSQGGAPAYKRERPIVRQYNSLLKNYQIIIKQLDDIQPPMKSIDAMNAEMDDGFDDFRAKRDE